MYNSTVYELMPISDTNNHTSIEETLYFHIQESI